MLLLRTGLMVLFASLLVAGCGVRPAAPYGGVRLDPSAVMNPFAPVSMKVHPLTRIDRAGDGSLRLICHIELRDAWGEPVKGVGDMQVDLYRADPEHAESPRAIARRGVQELTWDIDLSDMDLNTRLYDAPTRTYRLELTEVPRWLGEAPEAEQPRGMLRVILTTQGPHGEALVLEDEFVL